MISTLFTGLIFLLSVQSVASPIVLFEQNGKVGIKNEQGDVLIPASYEALGWSDGQLSSLEGVTGYKKDNRWGLITLANKIITKPVYESVTVAEGGLLYVTQLSTLSRRIQIGCINRNGEFVIPPVYDGLKVQSLRAIACVRDQKKFNYGLIDLKNTIIIPLRHKSITPIGSLRYAVENFEGRQAIYTDAGVQVTDFFIDSLSAFLNNVAILYKNGKQGLINREGVIVQEPVFSAVKIDEAGIVKTRAFNQWNVRDGKNNLLQNFEADDLIRIRSNVIKQDASLFTLCRADLTEVSQRYQHIEALHDRLFLVSKNNLVGVIDSEGRVILPCEFHKIQVQNNYLNTLVLTSEKKLYQIFTTEGKAVTSRRYDEAEPGDSYIRVKQKSFWGLLDRTGNEILYCVYDSLLEVGKHTAAVKFQGLFGVVDFQQKWLMTPQPDPLQLVNDSLVIVWHKGTQFLKKFDNRIVYFTTNTLEIKTDHLIEHTAVGKWKIDFNGRIVSKELNPESAVEEIYPSTEGLRAIKRNGRYGFVDDLGRLRIANRYEAVRPFENGLAPAKIRGKWGFINKNDNIAIQPAYDDVKMMGDFILVSKSNKFGLITHSGELRVPIRYDAITPLASGNFLIKNESLFGLLGTDGHSLLHTKYESVEDLNNGYIIVQQNQKFGLVTREGVTTIPIQFEKLFFDAGSNTYYTMKKSEWK